MTSGFTTLKLRDAVDVAYRSGGPRRLLVEFKAEVPMAEALPLAGTFVANAVEPSVEKLFGFEGRVYRAMEEGTHAGMNFADHLGLPWPRNHALAGQVAVLSTGRVFEWGAPDLDKFDLSAARARIDQLRRLARERIVVCDGDVHVRTEMPVWFAETASGGVYLMDRRNRPTSAPTFDIFDPGRFDEAMRMAAGGRDRRVRVHGSISDLDASFDEHRGTRFARGFSTWVAQASASHVLTMSGDLVRHWHRVGATQAELEPLDGDAAARAAVETVRFVERLVNGEAGEEMRSHFGRRWERILTRVEIEDLPFVAQDRQSAEARP